MKLRNVKIDESIKRQFKKALEDEHTVIDPTTADALQNEEDVKKQIEKEFKENDKAAEEVAKATAGDQAVKVKDRKELTKLLSENKNKKAKISRCLEEGFRYLVEWVEDKEDEKFSLDTLEKAMDEVDVSNIEVIEQPGREERHQDDAKEEPKLETFDEQMNYLAADEQEAIDGYNKVLALVEDEHVKEQLQHILDEEVAHKEFLEAVKSNKELTYSHNDEKQETEDEETEAEIIVGESLNEGGTNWDKIKNLFDSINKESTNETLDEEQLNEKNDYYKKSDDREQAIQMMVCDIYSKYSNEFRSTIYDLVANLKNDFPDKSDKEIQEIAEKAIVEETAADYLDTGNTNYLDKNYQYEESLDEDKKDKRNKGTVGAVIEKNREKLDALAFRNKTEMIKSLSKILEDESIEDKAYAKEVLRNANKKRTSQDILVYLYDIMLKQIGLGSPDAKEKDTKEEQLKEEIVELSPAQKELFAKIKKNKEDGWYDEYDEPKDIVYREWTDSSIEIPEEWCNEVGCDYNNVEQPYVDKYFEDKIYDSAFAKEVDKLFKGE